MSKPTLTGTLLNEVDCLATVNAEVECVAPGIDVSEINDLNLFLTPSSKIDGIQNNLSQGILRHMHHRSVELPDRYNAKNDAGFFSCRRLKGAGLYSGPSEEWMHKVRNVKKDQTGLVLGLQSLTEFQGAFDANRLLVDMGIETEFPLGALKLSEVIYQTRDGVSRVAINDAFDEADFPEEYKDIPFVIRVDAIGINHRLKDYIFAGELLADPTLNAEAVRRMLMEDVRAYLQSESRVMGTELPELEDNVMPYLEFILSRIYRNIAKLHKNGGVHGQLTEQNLTMDGKFIDYDTLQWLSGDIFEEKRQADLLRLEASVRAFLSIMVDDRQQSERLLEISKTEYGKHR